MAVYLVRNGKMPSLISKTFDVKTKERYDRKAKTTTMILENQKLS